MSLCYCKLLYFTSLLNTRCMKTACACEINILNQRMSKKCQKVNMNNPVPGSPQTSLNRKKN